MHARMFLSTATAKPELPIRGHRYAVVAAIITVSMLAGCASRTGPAPVTDMSGTGTGTVAPVPTGTYVVQPGDTLYKIAQAKGIDMAHLSRLNNITDPGQLRIGQVLKLDGTAAPEPGPVSPNNVATPIPVTPVAPAETIRAPRATDASVIDWAWPASGKVIQGFNANTKGIDVVGALGDPVTAAADGKVMYAGNGVRGLGNLILLGHTNGFITAYAHNQALYVKTGQEVKKGAKIASIGQTDTTSPRLHFEVRRSGTPVDPHAYLPAR